VWERSFPDVTMILLMLCEGPRESVNRDVLLGWECLNLLTGRLDWLPANCFESPTWRRLA
jgi:hypothetical protein